jgi:hypothetical protein
MDTERHVAVVAETNDPENRGRIRVRCAGLLGSEDAIVQRWVSPCLDWGFFLVPEVGDQVEIECSASSFRDETRGQSFVEEPNLRWRGKRFFGGDVTIHSMFTEANYGKRRGFATPGGHVLMLDDTDGKKKINFAWHGAGNDYAMLSFDDQGSIVLANKNGSMVYLNAKDGQLALIDEHGNSVSTDSDGIKIVDKNSNIISMKGTTVQVLSQSAVTLSCKDAVVDAGKVQLGGQPAVDQLLKGTAFNAALITWTAALATCLGTCAPPPTGLATFATATTTFLAQVLAALSTKSYTQ